MDPIFIKSIFLETSSIFTVILYVENMLASQSSTNIWDEWKTQRLKCFEK